MYLGTSLGGVYAGSLYGHLQNPRVGTIRCGTLASSRHENSIDAPAGHACSTHASVWSSKAHAAPTAATPNAAIFMPRHLGLLQRCACIVKDAGAAAARHEALRRQPRSSPCVARRPEGEAEEGAGGQQRAHHPRTVLCGGQPGASQHTDRSAMRIYGMVL